MPTKYQMVGPNGVGISADPCENRYMSDENKNIMRRVILEIMVGGNVALVDELFAENFVNSHGTVKETAGREAEKARIIGFRSAFPDVAITILDILGGEQMTTARVTLTGTHKGPLGKFSPTNKEINVSGITMMRFSDGKICEEWSIVDRLSMMEQLGFVSPS